jgi:hypothetical protein
VSGSFPVGNAGFMGDWRVEVNAERDFIYFRQNMGIIAGVLLRAVFRSK